MLTVGLSPGDANTGKWVPDRPLKLSKAVCQPYIKLHGSSNWTD